ncbi:MAG: hypothetical protein QS98_C0005G0040 [archaeon GW2011_AR3]|nr:MAG: hypothetical protein QS98_C0005G0040 [archaeon GW2011_AR3]
MENNQKKKKVFSILPKKFKASYFVGERVPSSGVYECSICDNYTAFKKAESFSRCEDCINEGRQEDGKWYVTNEVVHFMSKNLNIEFEKLETFQIRIADKITHFAGTMGFVYFHTVWFGLWMLMNEGLFGPKYVFDPYPFGLLTMIVSLEAIYLSTFIMISQNIMARQAELNAELDYQVNLKTEKEVAEILAMLKEIKENYAFGEPVKKIIKEASRKPRGRKGKKKEAREPDATKGDSLLSGAGIEKIEEPWPHDDGQDA